MISSIEDIRKKKLLEIGEYYKKLKISNPEKYKEARARSKAKYRQKKQEKKLTENNNKETESLADIAKKIEARAEYKRQYKLKNPEKVAKKLKAWKEDYNTWKSSNLDNCKMSKRLIQLEKINESAQLTLF